MMDLHILLSQIFGSAPKGILINVYFQQQKLQRRVFYYVRQVGGGVGWGLSIFLFFLTGGRGEVGPNLIFFILTEGEGVNPSLQYRQFQYKC